MRGEATYADWIAVDWGTSNLRAWAMTADGDVRAEATSDQGMSGLKSDEFEPALLALIDPWLGQGQTPVLACGMVGSRQGWAEASYHAVPTAPMGKITVAPCRDGRINMSILPGVKQGNPADVMRGEETQIAGYLAHDPQFDGILCLPGTHTKWVHISAGEIVSFQTFMTGEMFDCLTNHSVLRHSTNTSDWDNKAFKTAVSETLSRPEILAAKLFNIRAGDLLDGTPHATLKSQLSGLLIGAELAAARPYWLGQNIALIGAPKLTTHYATAMREQGLAPAQHSGDEMTLAGLTAAYKEHVA